MARTIEEINEEIDEIKDEMRAEKSVDVDDKIKIVRRSNKDLSIILGLLEDEKSKASGNGGAMRRLRRGGFN